MALLRVERDTRVRLARRRRLPVGLREVPQHRTRVRTQLQRVQVIEVPVATIRAPSNGIDIAVELSKY